MKLTARARPPHAHRPRVYPSAGQVARWLLIAVLCVAVFIAWSSVPEPDLMGLRP